MKTDLPTSPVLVNKPYSAPIELLHRGNDGWIAFARIDQKNGKWENLYSVEAYQLPSLFESFLEDLETDSYFSVNSFIHPGRKQNPHHAFLPQAKRGNDKVKYINAAFVDLDYYKQGFELYEIMASILRAQSQCVLPPASFFADSGRGLWAFWLLIDPETQKGVRAFDKNKLLWAKIQKSLQHRLMNLGADKNALDLSRVARVPGSVNSKVFKRVAYWIQADSQGRPFLYTLDGLKSFLNIEEEPLTPLESRLEELLSEPPEKEKKAWTGTERKTDNPKYEQRAKKGYYARWLHALNDFKILRDLRGGFVKGTRHHAALIYAALLWRHKTPEYEIFKEVYKLCEECIPPLTDFKDIKNIVKQAKKIGKLNNATISDFLKITPPESAYLGKLPPAEYPELTPSKLITPKISDNQRFRRQAIKDIIQEAQRPLSLRQIKSILEDEYNCDASIFTIRNDLDALKLDRRRRPKKRKLPSLFEKTENP